MKRSAKVLSIAALILLAGCSPAEKETGPDIVEEVPVLETNFLENKDIDGDKIPDKISFDYSGGAHCCYRLSLELSSDTIRREFPFEMDGGYVTGMPDSSQPQHFNIRDYDGDERDEIYMEIQTYNGRPNPIPAEWEARYGLSSNQIVFDFEDSLRIINVPLHISIEQYYISAGRDQDSSEYLAFKAGDDHYGYKYGFRDENGATAILPILDSVTPFFNGAAIVYKRSVPLLIDRNGKIIQNLASYHLIDKKIPEEGLILLANETISEYHYMNCNGELLNAQPYSDARPFTEGLAAVQAENELWGYIDKQMEWHIEPRFKLAHAFEGGKAFVELKDTMLWINRAGEWVE